VQEAREILGFRIIHAAVGMSPSQVIAIELVALLAVARRNHLDIEILVAPQAASLAAVGPEIRDRDATGNAGAAGLATRDVDMVAGTPVTARQGHFVELFELRRAGIDDEILRHAFSEIAAGVRQGLEQADNIGTHALFCLSQAAKSAVDA